MMNLDGDDGTNSLNNTRALTETIMRRKKSVLPRGSKVTAPDSDFEDDVVSQVQNKQMDQRTNELRSKSKHDKDRVKSKMVSMLEAKYNNENIEPLKKKKKVSKEPVQANVEDDNIIDEDEDSALAYWVLDNFDANSSELHLRNGCLIPVDAEDIHLVFGFPRGGMNGYIVVPMLRYLDNESLKSIHELNWCEYVIRNLIEHKRIWESNKPNSFGGPILFLTEILARGFRGGRLCPQYKLTGEDDVLLNDVEQTKKWRHNNVIEDDEMKKFANEFLAKSKLMADMMMQLILMIEKAPKHLCDNPQFKKIVEAGQQLVGCKLGGGSLQDSARPSQFYE
ncbi:hypothetical protein C2S52_010499 [Perilla frutescens var. hirtella]|nr:hypothetical protein C2S52_010499 [Perilla frutescens var. hirtella]